ncbi:MAG: DUF3526 domain-containing protein [Pseudomonadota bacterium]
MSLLVSLKREAWFLMRDRGLLSWLLVITCLSTFSVWSGLAEVEQQRATIERLLIADKEDRIAELAKQSDWGSAAYYSFHVTYDPPSDFAFAAMGQRDTLPWKHRLRMLALEGQIYEHDAGNPELALIGRFDFAFFAAFVLPLILIFLLHSLKANERVAGRFDLLNATARNDLMLWRTRAILIALSAASATILPMLLAGAASGVGAITLFSAAALVGLYVVFWVVVCVLFAGWERSAQVVLSALVGVWILLGTILPTGGRLIVDAFVPVPTGADILMTQREAVNDAWDLPVEDTMTPFVERHPEWTGYIHTGEGFDWPWYYAFQQVGDQKTEALSLAYQQGRLERDRMAGLISLITPPALLERLLAQLAQTDLRTAIAYENRVRAFHAELRTFFYPMLFQQQAYDAGKLTDLPRFVSGGAFSRVAP